MNPDELARQTVEHLTRSSIDWRTEIQRRPDESDDTYNTRMERLADMSGGVVKLLVIGRVPNREYPGAPAVLEPISRRVIPVIIG